MHYFGLQMGDIDAVEPDRNWLAQAKQEYLCQTCGRALPNPLIRSVAIRKHPLDYAFNFVSQAEVFVVRNDFLGVLGEEAILPHVQLGSLTLPTGTEVERFRFMRPHEEVLVRGRSKATAKGLCPRCGMLYYWPGPFVDWYLVRRSLASERPIYGISTGFTIIREDVYHRVQSAGITDIYLYELPILEEAQDGLPTELHDHPSPQERESWATLLSRDV